MNYTELVIAFQNKADTAQTEIVSAVLSDIGFESFVETENQLMAYIPEGQLTKDEVTEIISPMQQTMSFSWHINTIAEQNWNALWESNYEPVVIADRCHIRAPFHPIMQDKEFEILIEPKMSFGTAHHETTQMMIEMMLQDNFSGKDVLDMGCGTGVLAILASKMGAKNILAIDNDPWAFENSRENVDRNQAMNISVYQGDHQLLRDKSFHTIIANINRNILLDQFASYAKSLSPGGDIYLSGFLEEDIPVLMKEAEKYGFKLKTKRILGKWSAILVG